MTDKNIRDHIGIVLSCACIIHCIAVPFVLVLGSFVFHTTFFILAILISGHSIYHAYKKHCRHIVIFFGIMGIVLLASDLVLDYIAHQTPQPPIDFSGRPYISSEHIGHNHAHPQKEEIHVISIFGGISLILFHFFNITTKKIRCC